MYIIEGNIGAGKSTFLRLLKQSIPSLNAIFEPLHNWQSQVYGQSLLANFYQDPNRWAYTLETLAMVCRVRDHQQEQDLPGTHVVERSIYSGHYCFALNCYESGFITSIEWQVYLHWFNYLIPGKCKAPQGFIYLRVDPAVAWERIKKRNRHAERKLMLTYLQQLHKRHEDFLIHKKNILPELAAVPVLILDCNQEFESDPAMLNQHIQAFKNFITTTEPITPLAQTFTEQRKTL